MAKKPKRKKAAKKRAPGKKRASRKKPLSRPHWTPSERLLSSAARIVGEERARALSGHARNERAFLRAVLAEAPARTAARTPARPGPQDRYSAAADQLPLAIFVVDSEERFTYVNRAGEIMTGRSREELLGRSVAGALGEDSGGEDSLAERLSVVVRRARSGREPVEYEIAYALPSGARFDVGFTASVVSRPPLHREESDVVIVGRDLHTPGEGITLRGKSGLSAEHEADLRRRLLQAERQMARSDRLMAIGQMAAGFVHEINNPLGALQGLVQLLQMDIDRKEPASAVLADVGGEIERIERLADSMLEIALSSVGQGTEGFAPVNVVEAVEAVVRVMTPQLKVNRVRVRREIAVGGGEAWVIGDPDRLRQILMNLILNASQAMSPAARSVGSSGRPDDQERPGPPGAGSHPPRAPLRSFGASEGAVLRSLGEGGRGGRLTIRVREDAAGPADLPERPSRAEDLAAVGPEADVLTIRREALRRAATDSAPPWREGMELVRIEVEDTGPGIPKEVLGGMFEPFFTTKPAGEGTGLGLSTSEAICRAHGGTITAENVSGGGARFTIRLPACERPGGGERRTT